MKVQSCTQLPNGTYTKDLSIVDTDLSRVCLVDNSPISYSVNEGTHMRCLPAPSSSDLRNHLFQQTGFLLKVGQTTHPTKRF